MPRDWKSDLSALRSVPLAQGLQRIEGILAAECGEPVKVRTARVRLLLMVMSVLKGRPKTIGVDGQMVMMVSLKDLADILCGSGLEEFQQAVARVPKGRRRIVSNR